jgi:hypothetical protein
LNKIYLKRSKVLFSVCRHLELIFGAKSVAVFASTLEGSKLCPRQPKTLLKEGGGVKCYQMAKKPFKGQPFFINQPRTVKTHLYFFVNFYLRFDPGRERVIGGLQRKETP